MNINQHHYAKEAADVEIMAEGKRWLRTPTQRW